MGRDRKEEESPRGELREAVREGIRHALSLVECFAVVLLRIRVRRIPLVEACALGLLGLALAGSVLLFLLLWPAVVLQSVDTSMSVFGLWSAGLLAGSYVGVALGLRPTRWLRSLSTQA